MPTAVGSPDDLAVEDVRRRHARGLAAVLGGRCENFAVHHECDLFSVGGECEVACPGGEREVFGTPVPTASPLSVIGTSFASPLAMSSVHTPKFLSKVIALPSSEIDGHNKRPFVKCVTCDAAPPAAGRFQMFSAPLRSLI